MIYILNVREKGSDRNVPRQCLTALEAVAALSGAKARGADVPIITRGKMQIDELTLRAEAEAERRSPV